MSIAAPEPVVVPPSAPRASFWGAHRRRPIFLLSLGIGLLLTLVLLPQDAWSALGNLLLAQTGLLFLIFLFVLIALSLIWSAGQRWDSGMFLYINLHGYRHAWLDRLMWFATHTGNVVTALLLAGMLIIFNLHSLAVEIILGTLTLLMLVETIKIITDRARPFLALAETRMIGWRESGRSFPSGHTAQTFFLATLLSHWFHVGVWGAVGLYAIAALVGFTRIYIGVHYPRDVIGGALLGSVWGILVSLSDPLWMGRIG
jgi:membrane-associated phospholipid phosphatase